MSIPQETRRESYEKTAEGLGTCTHMVYRVVLERGPIGAWTIAKILDWDVYVVRPRLTELQKAGRIRAAGKGWCERTHRHEATWEVVTEANGQMGLGLGGANETHRMYD